jgi:G:T-mismatch repair DNA endonuclease (very short patch repair protein)
VELTTEQEQNEAATWYSQQCNIFSRFRTEIEQWITRAKQNIEQQKDKISFCSRNTAR